MRAFPFDKQWLVVELMFDRDNKAVCFAPCNSERIFRADGGDELAIEPKHCPALSEFYLRDKIASFTLSTEQSASRSQSQYSRQRFILHVSRKPTAHLWNIALTIFMITTLSFAAIFIPMSDPTAVQDRLVVLFTLLMTSVSFRMTVRTYLPKVPYMTTLDWYVLCGSVVVAAAAAMSALVSLHEPPEDSAWTEFWKHPITPDQWNADAICWISLAAVWATCNAYFIFWSCAWWLCLEDRDTSIENKRMHSD